MLVKMIRARSDANDSIMYAQHVFAELDFLVHKHVRQRLGSVLEIGPGVNLGVLFCFVACGVERAAGVDIERISELRPAFYETLRHYLTCVEGVRWWRYFTAKPFPHVSFPPCLATPIAEELLQRIDYRHPVSCASLPFEDNSFELVYSVSALEHVPEPDQTIGEIRRVLRDGGMSIQELGLQHHGAADPLRFLEWSDEEYAAKAQPYGDGKSLQGLLDGTWQGEVFCNRLRLSDWLDLFQRYGFAILEIERTVLLDQCAVRPERFVEPFRSKPIDDLAVLGFRIVAQCCK
ncbi:MAG TPA: methyltransferase domain-containing protein [Candidatus Binatia bacterium]|nr:methyltransferase domain-containing protein [Candidatus Binatia bacterium]